MELNEKQANERLNSPNNLANRLAEFRKEKKRVLDVPSSTLSISPGRTLPHLPAEAREDIEKKLLSGEVKVKEVAEEYGISPASASHIKTKAEKAQRAIRAAEEQARELARDKFLEQTIKDEASKKMLLAMGLITEEKLEKLKATDLARVSSSLSTVVGTYSPKQAANAAQINLVVYSPEIRSEDKFQIVEIGARRESDLLSSSGNGAA